MLPERYLWLNNIGVLPKMVDAFLSLYGIHEKVGPGSNPMILKMAQELGIPNLYTEDDVPWCGLSMSYVAKIAGKPVPFQGYHLLRAKSWEIWGVKVDKKDAMLGDVLVFTRSEGAHVGLYIAETPKTYCVLGGNQGNAVSIVEVHKDRLSAVRRYYDQSPPVSVKKYFMDSNGLISKNEA